MKHQPKFEIVTRLVATMTRMTLLAVLALVTGCTSVVKTEFKPETQFPAYRTFAVLPHSGPSPAGDPGVVLRLAEPAKAAAITALTAKGFQQAELKQADFAVNLRGESIPRVRVDDWGYTRYAHTARYGRIPIHVGEVDVHAYDERTLTVEIFDNKSHELVWVGWLKRDTTEAISVPDFQKAVAKILSKFPPTPAAAK